MYIYFLYPPPFFFYVGKVIWCSWDNVLLIKWSFTEDINDNVKGDFNITIPTIVCNNNLEKKLFLKYCILVKLFVPSS